MQPKMLNADMKSFDLREERLESDLLLRSLGNRGWMIFHVTRTCI